MNEWSQHPTCVHISVDQYIHIRIRPRILTYTILHAAVCMLRQGLLLSQFLHGLSCHNFAEVCPIIAVVPMICQGLSCRSFAKVCPIAVVPTIRQGLSTHSFTLLYACSGPPLLYITITQRGTLLAVSWDSCSTDGLRTVAE